MPARNPLTDHRTAAEQANQQLAYIFITIGIGSSAGVVTGLIARHPVFGAPEPKNSFSDKEFWIVPQLEMPYHFDHRGEISRGESGLKVNQKTEFGSAETSALETRIAKLEQLLSSGGRSFAPQQQQQQQAVVDKHLATVFEHLLQRIDGVATLSRAAVSPSPLSAPTRATSTLSLFSNPVGATRPGTVTPVEHV